jgi:hypothetical protein
LWATSDRVRNMMNFTPTPSNTSLALPFFHWHPIFDIAQPQTFASISLWNQGTRI